MGLYLASKEVWRNKGRYILFSMVIALITVLVLFIAALAEGLGLANKEYLDKLDAELLAFQANVDLSLNSSRIGRAKLNDIRRVEGVKEIGPLGFSVGSLIATGEEEPIDVSLIGIEAGMPGNPPILSGRGIQANRGSEVILDGNIQAQTNIKIGDTITIKTIQGTDESFFNMQVIGFTDKRQYLYQPSVFLPYQTWDRIRAQGGMSSGLVNQTANIVAIKLEDPQNAENVTALIKSQVDDIEIADIPTTIEAIPGYSAQQTTTNTQKSFTLLIGLLVIGGFFQIQTLQKVPQIGVLKAIGAPNKMIATAVVFQIILVTTFGVLIGTRGDNSPLFRFTSGDSHSLYSTKHINSNWLPGIDWTDWWVSSCACGNPSGTAHSIGLILIIKREENRMSDIVIETKGVSKIYQTGEMVVKAVDTVSMKIRKGEFVALVGPSGSGKTTMLAMLAALLSPTEGEAFIDGQDLGLMKDVDRVAFRRQKIGFTFQQNNLVPYLSVLENVELMLQLNGKLNPQDHERALGLLTRLGLEERLNNLPSQISGGQQQRVAIARSLIHNPSVVLADEPTASLDTERAYQVVQIFADLIHEENKAGIMVTHDLRMCRYVDRVIQMIDGTIEIELDDKNEINEFISCG